MDTVKDKCREMPIIYLLGNKLDEVESDPSKREIAQQEAVNFASRANMQYFEVSSLTSQNTKKTFKKVEIVLI